MWKSRSLIKALHSRFGCDHLHWSILIEIFSRTEEVQGELFHQNTVLEKGVVLEHEQQSESLRRLDK